MSPPKEWGPPAWKFIFYVIDDMPEYPSDTEQYRMFFESLQGVLPCERCRQHYSLYLIHKPPPVWSREATRKWANELRAEIRRRNALLA